MGALALATQGAASGREIFVIALGLAARAQASATFTPHVDDGDNVIIINAEKVRLTGNKYANKVYYWHTGYAGGIKERTARAILEGRFPERVVQKADGTAPHEVLLVIDGNTGQNALTQVKAFDDALQLTGLIITKLDGTAKGGVIAAIARERPIPVYFIGVGEKLEELETFNAREFAQALLG